MASLWRHPESKFWVACFTDRDGRRLKRSTKETVRSKAEKIALSFEEAARRKRTAKQVRQVIAALHRDITGEELPTITMSDFVRDWLTQKKPETKHSTFTFYTNATSKFLKFLGPDAYREIGEITREHIRRFRNAEAETLAPRTVNHDLKCLKMLFRAARREGLLSDDPTEFVDTIRQTKSQLNRRPFTVPELKAVLSVADEEWRSMILFGFYLGLRLGDIARLTWENIDLQRNEIRLIAGKTEKTIILPIAEPLRKHIEALPSSDDPEGPMHPRAFAIVTAQGRTGHLSICRLTRASRIATKESTSQNR
jgi:integrase